MVRFIYITQYIKKHLYSAVMDAIHVFFKMVLQFGLVKTKLERALEFRWLSAQVFRMCVMCVVVVKYSVAFITARNKGLST